MASPAGMNDLLDVSSPVGLILVYIKGYKSIPINQGAVIESAYHGHIVHDKAVLQF